MRAGPRPCPHAKCIVVDDRLAFVTSANFTETAHHRNIEVGLLVQSGGVAPALRSQFDALVSNGDVWAAIRGTG